MLANMEDFADISKARESYALFAEAMEKGREILIRAGIAEAPPPVPEFDAVFGRLNSAMRQQLFSEVRPLQTITSVDALRIWQPILKKAFARPN